MGKARRKPSPKRPTTTRAVAAATANAATNNTINSKDDINNCYESFPIIRSRSRSRSQSRTRSVDATQEEAIVMFPHSPSNQPKAETPDSLEDPGNPVGNAIDFCVNGVNDMRAKSVDLCFLQHTDVCSLSRPFEITNFEQVLEDVWLCNKLAGKIETTKDILNGETPEEDKSGNIIENAQDESMKLSSSKRGKHGWKKTLMIVPSKKFLRSMGLKRKKSLTKADENNKAVDDDEESLIWNGIMDKTEPGPEGDDVHLKSLSRDSDEDTLFTNLNDVDDDSIDTAGTKESQTQTKTTPGKENDFGDEGPEKQEGAPDDTSCHFYLASSTLCSNFSSTLQEGTVDKDVIPENGDLVISRNFEAEKQTEKVKSNTRLSPKISIVPSSTTHANGKKGDVEEEAKVGFEIILADSRFGHRKWGNKTPWKKLEVFLTMSGASLSTKSLAGRSLASRKSTRSLPILRKQRVSDRSRRHKKASSISKPRRSSWKQITARAFNTSDSSAMPVKDQSSTTVMGLHQWSWGVFAKDPKEVKEQEDCDDIDDVDSTNNPETRASIQVPLVGATIGDHDHDGYDSTDDCTTDDDTRHDGDAYSQSRDGSTIGLEEGSIRCFEDFTHDGWIMDEDQLVSFEDDDTRKTCNSYSYHTNFSDYSFDENETDDSVVDREFRETVIKARSLSRDNETEKSSTPAMTQGKKGVEMSNTKREFFLSLRKSFSFNKKKGKKGRIDISSDISVNAELCDSNATEADGASVIEAVLLTRGVVPPLKVTASEHRDESSSTTGGRSRGTSRRGVNPSSESKQSSSLVTNKGSAFTKSKKFWKPKHDSPSPSTSKDIITVVTSSSKDCLDRYNSVALFDEESHEGDDFDDSSASSSTNSPWETDDDDTQSEDNLHFVFEHEFYSSHSHNVIRE